jgi:cellulose synthase (UDP-forming)
MGNTVEMIAPRATADSAVPRRARGALVRARNRAAPPSNIALAARRFGDRYPERRNELPIRASGVLVLALTLVYVPWLFTHLALGRPWLTIPFAVATVFSAACVLVSVLNSWWSEIPTMRPLRGRRAPIVAVIIPTCGEPVPMVLRTLVSVLEQDYPSQSLAVVVSDDAHNPELEDALAGLGVLYHHPPPRWAPGRDGAAKAGNLNSALQFVLSRVPEVKYVETRDADDEVGSLQFLRQTVGQLEADEKLAFVQTVKEAQVSAGDPFCNFDGQFYRGQMLCRNAANAVFPCGSGLVWRRVALEDIGAFPTWNLVEDFQSGVEALRRGWRSCYLPIVGAVGQHSPEDVPNVIKQRGTWAIDTVRLMVWGDLRGLNVRQRLAFTETLLFYVHAFTTLVYVPVTALAAVSVMPLTASPLSCLEHLLPYALVSELRLLVLNRPFGDRRRRQRRPLRALWRVKVMWTGLAPVYVLAACKAVLGGRHRKPIYKVTRKTTEHSWYWRETLPNMVLCSMVPIALVISVVLHRLPHPVLLLCAGYWGIIASATLAGFVIRGWFGKPPVKVPITVERRRPRADRRAEALRAQAATKVIVQDVPVRG